MEKETLAAIIGKEKSSSRIGKTDDGIRKNLMVVNLKNKEGEYLMMHKKLAKAEMEKNKEYWGN